MRFFSSIVLIVSITALVFLTACGDHSSKKTTSGNDTSGSSSGSNKNIKLVADAGKDKTILLGEEFFLDGAASSPRSEIQKFYWLKISGPQIVFQQDLESQLITPSEIGSYTFRLFVFSENGNSDTDDVTFTVVGRKPIADAGDSKNVVVNTPTKLDGSKSEIRSSGTLSYLWTPVSYPAEDYPIINTTASITDFTPQAIGQYVFSLVVSTGEFTSDPDYVTINANNVLPVAHAGSDRSVLVNSAVTLDGSKSTYPEDTVPIFIWEQVSGPAVTLVNKQTATPSFFAEGKGTYAFTLTLKVNGITSNTDSVIITIIDTGDSNLPIADPGPDQSGFVNEILELDGSKSYSPSKAPLFYTWALAEGDSTGINISNLSGSKISVLATKTGVYKVSLIVYDGTYTSAMATAIINIYNRSDMNMPPEFFEPIASITARIGEPIMLDVGAVDYEGDPIHYNTIAQPPKEVNYRLDTGAEPVVIFKPNLPSNLQQKFTFTAQVDDGISQNSRQINVTVTPHLFGRNDANTAIIGHVVDINGTPLQDVSVHCGISFSKTDKTGRFSVVRTPDGQNIPLIVDGRNAYTQIEKDANVKNGYYELETFTVSIEPFKNNHLERNIILYKIYDEGEVPVKRNKATVLKTYNDPAMQNFQLTIPAASPMGVTAAYTAPLAAYEMDKDSLVREWNEYFNPDLLIRISPHHVKYRIPAALEIPNRTNIAENTILTLWKFNMNNNSFAPLSDIQIHENKMITSNGGLTENGYIFPALSVAGTIRTQANKPTVSSDELSPIFLLRDDAIDLRKKLGNIIAQEKMSDAFNGLSLLASFEKSYKNGSLVNSSLANAAYQRLKKEYTKGADLAATIEKAKEIGNEILNAITPLETKLNEHLKTIKRNAALIQQMNDVLDLFATGTFNIKDATEKLKMKSFIAKQDALFDLTTSQLKLVTFDTDTFTEIIAAKLQESVSQSSKFYKGAHPYYETLLLMDEIIKKITDIIDTQSQPNRINMMSVLQILEEGNVVETLPIKTINNQTFIANLDQRKDLIGKTVRAAAFSKPINKYGYSRTIVLGQESAFNLDIYINQDAQLIVYELPEESLRDFPKTVEIQKTDNSTFLATLTANTFVQAPAQNYFVNAISTKQNTTLIPFTLSPKKPYFIRFGQIEVNTIANVDYQDEPLSFFNQTTETSFNQIHINDLKLLPEGVYVVRSAAAPQNNDWAGTITLNAGDTKRPFGALEYTNFGASEAYPINYSIISANGKIAYPNLPFGKSVVLLPGSYKLQAIQDEFPIDLIDIPISITAGNVTNPFGSIAFYTSYAQTFQYDQFKLEIVKDDKVLFTDLLPGKDLLTVPGKYKMRVVGMETAMKYDITVKAEETASVMGIVIFSEPEKLYNITQDGKLIYQNVGAGKTVILTPGLYKIDAVEEDGIPPQLFNVVFNSVFVYPDDTIIQR